MEVSVEKVRQARKIAQTPISFETPIGEEEDAHVHPLGQLFRGGLAAKFLDESADALSELVDDLDHVNGNTDGARLVGDGACDGLANPPGGVGGELVAAAPVEPVGAFHEPEIAFLDQVEKLQAMMGVFLGDGDDQAKVGFGQFYFCLLRLRLTPLDEREGAFEAGQSNFARLFDLFQVGAARAQLFASFGGDIAQGGVHAALEAACFALDGAQALDSRTHFVDQAFFLQPMERDVAYRQRNLDAGPGNGSFDSKIGLPFGFWGLGQLFRLLQRGFVELSDLINLPKRLLSLVGDFFFGELFIMELNNFLDGAHTFAQAFADGDDFLNDDGRERDGLQAHELPALDALGDDSLAFAGQQRD